MTTKPTDPLFIIGSGRSGTTILGRCLGEHPSLLFIDEPRFINHILFPAVEGSLDQETFLARLRVSDDGSGKEPMKFLRRMREHYSPLLEAQTLTTLEAEINAHCLRFYEDLPKLNRAERLQAVRNLVHRFMVHTTGLIGGTRWLIKQPDLSEDLDRLLETFPDARFVHIIRNPFDVLHSRVRRGFQEDYESALQVWSSRLQAIARFNNRVDCLLTISFEDFANNTGQVLRRIGDFANLSSDHWIEGAGRWFNPTKANIGRGHYQFSHLEQEAVLLAWNKIDRTGGHWLSGERFEMSRPDHGL